MIESPIMPVQANMERKSPAQAMMFEIAWEVCQQVGGIYTVIRSKIPSMTKRWGKNYVLVGPYNPAMSKLEFEPARPAGKIAKTIAQLEQQGFSVHYGHWLVPGQPATILLDYNSVMHKLPEIKKSLYENHYIETQNADPLVDKVIAFGYMVSEFFTELAKHNRKKTVTHFHEWMASSAIPEMRKRNLPFSIVFTTHATMLGRIEAQHDENFYNNIQNVDWNKSARHFNILAQVQLERAAAHGSHIMTTVSDITNDECEHLLGRRADYILPNGLNIERFVAMHEFQNLHKKFKERINQFIMSVFFPSYTFDLSKTVYFFSSGRFEYRNKGYDLTLESLARLNAKMKAEKSDKTVVFFLITKKPYHCINSEILRRTSMLEELNRNCENLQEKIGRKLFLATAKGEIPDLNELVSDYWNLRLKRIIHARQTDSLPTIVTHDLVDDSKDEVLKQLRYLGLINRPEDPVKVVYHPDFVSASSPLFGLDYDHFVRGCHLGIFPSFYEPWGYTPLECIARGIPAITSDQSGFGSYVVNNLNQDQSQGLYVASRKGKSDADSAEDIANWLLDFTRKDTRQRIAMRNKTESNAELFDWSHMALNYDLAHDSALALLKK